MLLKKYFIISFLIIVVTFALFFPIFNKHLFTGLTYYKISKNINVKNNINKTLENLHNFMIFNVDNDLDPKFFPVFDKYTFNALLDGYTDCSGSAAIYLWILMFLDINTNLIPLYDSEYKISPHTILYASHNKKNFVIDPFFNFTFLKENSDFASLDNICKNNINVNQLNLLIDAEYNYFENFCYYKKNIMRSNFKLPNYFIILLNYLPNFYIDFVLSNAIKLKYFKNNYLKGRMFYIIGNYDQALSYFDKVESEEVYYYDFLLGADELINDYEIKDIESVKAQVLAQYYKKLISINTKNKTLFTHSLKDEKINTRYKYFSKIYNLNRRMKDL